MLTNSKAKCSWPLSVELPGIPDTNKNPHSPTFLHRPQWALIRKSRGTAGKRHKRALKMVQRTKPTCFSEASLRKAKPDSGRGAGNSSIPSKKSIWCWKGQNSLPLLSPLPHSTIPLLGRSLPLLGKGRRQSMGFREVESRPRFWNDSKQRSATIRRKSKKLAANPKLPLTQGRVCLPLGRGKVTLRKSHTWASGIQGLCTILAKPRILKSCPCHPRPTTSLMWNYKQRQRETPSVAQAYWIEDGRRRWRKTLWHSVPCTNAQGSRS